MRGFVSELFDQRDRWEPACVDFITRPAPAQAIEHLRGKVLGITSFSQIQFQSARSKQAAAVCSPFTVIPHNMYNSES